MSTRADFVAGMRGGAPMLPPIFTAGIVVGVAATEAGLSVGQAVGMALLVNSPPPMLTALELGEAGAPAVVVVVASLTVVVHFLILSLSIGSYFAGYRTRWKWFLAYFLTTTNYALSVDRLRTHPETSLQWYYLGVSVPYWATWQLSVLVGIAFGGAVPAGWQLGFVVPLAFIALLMRLVRDRPSVVAALVAGGVAVFGGRFPFRTGVIVATVVGTLVGILVDTRGVGA